MILRSWNILWIIFRIRINDNSIAVQITEGQSLLTDWWPHVKFSGERLIITALYRSGRWSLSMVSFYNNSRCWDRTELKQWPNICHCDAEADSLPRVTETLLFHTFTSHIRHVKQLGGAQGSPLLLFLQSSSVSANLLDFSEDSIPTIQVKYSFHKTTGL